MKIINIVPGFGGTFYCGNCLRDSAFIKALKKMGHDAVLLPIYLPLSINNEHYKNDIPVFYGAVNIYIKQKLKLSKNLPEWLQHFLNSKPILNYAAKKAGSTRAIGHEEMTISMLKGSEGFMKKELEQLIDYLKHHEKPDVVHLSNALLLGLANRIKTELKIPVVCSLQDEDIWVDAMAPSFREKVWKLMATKGKDVDTFVAVSSFYANEMKAKLEIPDSKMQVIPIGVNPENYTVFEPSLNPPTLGYLSRLCEENGLEILIDAFIELKKKEALRNIRLKLTGGHTDDDKHFINKQIKKLNSHGFMHDVEFIEDYRPEAIPKFFQGLSVVSVPVLKGEAFGLYQLDSLASGIPVVQPALGAFPEMVKESKGGFIYQPNTSQMLAAALSELLSDKEKLHQLSKDGRNAVVHKYNSQVLSDKMVEVYQSLILLNMK
jgi:glycosyltransferase involved in cell wall biosynthesis